MNKWIKRILIGKEKMAIIESFNENRKQFVPLICCDDLISLKDQIFSSPEQLRYRLEFWVSYYSDWSEWIGYKKI